MANLFAGTWSYRSLVNETVLSTEFNNLEFGRANLVLDKPESGRIIGTIGGTGWSLDINGRVTSENPTVVRFQGRGEIGGEIWVYDYMGFVVPDWPDGINQVDAIVGTVIRTEPHSSGQAEAGFVASWYAVRQD